MQIGMRADWWGIAGEKIHKLLGRIGGSEVLSGSPGSPKDHFGVPYTITEEFVAVYRMHPLNPTTSTSVRPPTTAGFENEPSGRSQAPTCRGC